MSDFIVIGGGIAGLSTAARLSELGTVRVLEREDHFGHHASGRSAAMYEANYGQPSTITLNIASRAYHEAAGVLSPRGFMLVGTDAEAAAFAADVETMKLAPVPVAEAQRMVPILDSAVITRAAHSADGWDIDTDKLMQGFLRTLRQNGGTAQTRATVTALARTATGWQVTLADGAVLDARALVNAAGAWVDEIARLAGIAPLGVTPLRRSMGRIPAPGGHDVSAWPMLFGPGETWYAKPDAGALLVSPAEEHPMTPHDAFADDMVLAEGFARYEAVVTEPVTRLIASWAGLRTFAPDRNLVLGPDPRDPSFVWCAGQGGYGMQSSPAYSRLIADLIGGRPPEIPASVVSALSPARFA